MSWRLKLDVKESIKKLETLLRSEKNVRKKEFMHCISTKLVRPLNSRIWVSNWADIQRQ
jgi:hypothetical protein